LMEYICQENNREVKHLVGPAGRPYKYTWSFKRTSPGAKASPLEPLLLGELSRHRGPLTCVNPHPLRNCASNGKIPTAFELFGVAGLAELKTIQLLGS
jgi:hypothetical protein